MTVKKKHHTHNSPPSNQTPHLFPVEMSPPNGAPPEQSAKDYLHTPQDAKKEEEEPLNDELIEDDTEVVVPPDGGWGWMVVFASFMCNMIVDGIIFSFGSFLVPISREFGSKTSAVALVGSLMSGFYLIVGPFASALANRYGFRLVAIGGSILAAIAFALANFAMNVEYLCVVFGVLGGIGFGFIYVPSIITVGFYFEKWRALATGIGVCGSGIGTFLFAPLTKMLIENLGWRSALLCQGAVVLASVVFGLLYRPLKPTKVKDITDDDNERNELKMDPDKLPPLTKLKMEKALEAMGETHQGSQGSLNRFLGVTNNANYPRASDVYHTISVPNQRVLDVSCYEKRLSIPFIVNDEKIKNLEGKERLLNKSANPIITSNSRRGSTHDQEVNRPMYRDDIFFSASLTRLPQYTSRTSIAYNLTVTRVPTKNDIDEEKKKSCMMCPEAVKRTLATMLDYSLLKSPSFLILAFGGFFTMMGFYVPFMYLENRAGEARMEEKYASFLIASIGISNTIGRVLCGVLSSFPGVNALFVTNAALTIGGIATMMSGFSMSPEYQFIYCGVFGLSISTFASLRSIVVVDLLGLEKLTNAFGLLLLFQGVAAIIGSPLAGAFKEAVGSYDASFYFSGALLLVSAVMCYPLNYINRIEMAKKKHVDCKAVAV